jgi:hypothetical protein
VDLIRHKLTRVHEIADLADAEQRGLYAFEKAEADQLLADVNKLKTQRSELARLSAPSGDEFDDDDGLYGAFRRAGFDARTKSRVVVSAAEATGLRVKAGTFDGDLSTTGIGVVDLVPPVALGADGRFLFPRLATLAIPGDATSIMGYRQKERTLASTSDVIRDVDDTSPKPETATVSEVVAAPLHQIATISSGTPNVLLQNSGFRSWVTNDLQLAYRRAIDAHVVDEITNAGPDAASDGDNIYEQILYAQEVVAEAGYDASLVVLSPGDTLALKLLQMTGGDTYAFAQGPPSVITTPTVSDDAGFVMDPGSAGTLYLSPASFAIFEEEAGSTNSSTVRFESNGLFLLQRLDAIAYLTSQSS